MKLRLFTIIAMVLIFIDEVVLRALGITITPTKESIVSILTMIVILIPLAYAHLTIRKLNAELATEHVLCQKYFRKMNQYSSRLEALDTYHQDYIIPGAQLSDGSFIPQQVVVEHAFPFETKPENWVDLFTKSDITLTSPKSGLTIIEIENNNKPEWM